MGHPELVDVLGLGRLGLTTGVSVHVHEAGHDVVPREVDLALGIFRATFLADGYAWETHRLDLDYAIALDDDVHRSPRWGAGPVDDRGTPQDEPAVRTTAFIGPPGRGRRPLCHGLGGQGQNGEDGESRAQQRVGDSHSSSSV